MKFIYGFLRSFDWIDCTFLLLLLSTLILHGQTKLDFNQLKQPSVVLIQRAICVQPLPVTTSDCSGMELYSLKFSDGSQKIMVGIPDDGTISKDAKWTIIPITANGPGVSPIQVR